MDGSRSQLRLYWDRTLDANSKIPGAFAIPHDGGLLHVLFFGGVLFFWDGMKSLDSFVRSKLSYLFAIRHMSA